MRSHTQEEFAAWCATVRDPATAANAPARTVQHPRTGGKATYEIAPIPAGFAWKYRIDLNHGGCSSIPWTGPEPTREAALNALQTALETLARRWPDMAPIATTLIADLAQPSLGIEAH